MKLLIKYNIIRPKTSCGIWSAMLRGQAR